MSNLRDRLKKISAEKKTDALSTPPARPKCAMRVQFADIPKLNMESDILQLLCGEDYSALHLKPEDCIFLDTGKQLGHTHGCSASGQGIHRHAVHKGHH